MSYDMQQMPVTEPVWGAPNQPPSRRKLTRTHKILLGVAGVIALIAAIPNNEPDSKPVAAVEEPTEKANTAPEIDSLRNVTIDQGEQVSIKVDATDVDEDDLRFRALGLPSGVTSSPTTGRMTGTPKVSGTFDIEVIASDGEDEARQSFTLNVNAPEPAPAPTPAPAPAPAPPAPAAEAPVIDPNDPRLVELALEMTWDGMTGQRRAEMCAGFTVLGGAEVAKLLSEGGTAVTAQQAEAFFGAKCP